MKKVFFILILMSLSLKIFSQSIGDSLMVISDIDGNKYKIVKIGTQTWMAENLKTTKYNDGSSIPNVTSPKKWLYLTKGAWCYFNNDETKDAKYGKLYNWYAVSRSLNGNKNICPSTWHVPTDTEWTVLTDYLGGDSIAGGKMKAVDSLSWKRPNTGATNSSFFTGLPGGIRPFDAGDTYLGYHGYWWSSTEDDIYYAWYRYLNFDNSVVNRSSHADKKDGFSIRCLKD